MSFGSLVLLAVGLAMDATAVSITLGLGVARVRLRHAVSVALFFGGSQGLLPVLGWLLGDALGPTIAAWDHWFAFAVLTGVGLTMLFDGGDDDPDAPPARSRFGLGTMAALALATSIDAFAVGLALPMLDAPLARSAVTIGVVTALMSVVGLYAGRRVGARLGRRLDRLGGIVLIGLGVGALFDGFGWFAGG